MSPIVTSGLPLVRAINAVSFTKSKESKGLVRTLRELGFPF